VSVGTVSARDTACQHHAHVAQTWCRGPGIATRLVGVGGEILIRNEAPSIMSGTKEVEEE